MENNSLLIIIILLFVLICILVAFIAWKKSEFFIAPREHWRKSKWGIFKMRLSIVFTAICSLFALIVYISVIFFRTPENNAINSDRNAKTNASNKTAKIDTIKNQTNNIYKKASDSSNSNVFNKQK